MFGAGGWAGRVVIGTTFDGFCCGWLAFAVMGLSPLSALGSKSKRAITRIWVMALC